MLVVISIPSAAGSVYFRHCYVPVVIPSTSGSHGLFKVLELKLHLSLLARPATLVSSWLAGPFWLWLSSLTLSGHTYVMIFIQNCTDIMSDEFV